MWPEKRLESSFPTGRFRINGPVNGFAGSAIAILIGFIEQASAHAAKPTWSGKSIADLLADLSSGAAANEHHASNHGASPEHAPPGHAHDDAPFAPTLSTQSDGADGSISSDADSWWFDAIGPGHVVLGTEADHSSVGEFSGFFDASSNIPAPGADVAFTSAASSSFQYSGSSILDTAPGGAHSEQIFSISSEALASNANIASSGQTFGEAQSVGAFENNLAADNSLKSAGASFSGSAVAPPSFGSEAVSGHANAALPGGTGAALPAWNGGIDDDFTNAAPAGGSGAVLQAWNGDIGTGYTKAAPAGGTGNGDSGGVPGVTNAADGQGLVINVVYDASVANAPAGFTKAVANVVAFYESHFHNPVTITIDVGYGEIDGQSLEPFALGESEANMTPVSYAQLQSALVNNATAIGETAAAASLLDTSPVNGEYWIPTAEAQALGLVSSDSVTLDGYAGFTNVAGLSDYSATNTSGAVPNNEYDMFGAIAHEFSEIMGRQMLDGAEFAGAAGYTALDLFHYSAPGIPDFSGTMAGYFSPDGGSTNLGNFNTNQNGDFGDWASSAGNNSYLAFSDPGVLNSVTASDLTVMNLLGWDSTPAPASAIFTPPPQGYDVAGATVSVSAASGVLANVTDTNANGVPTVTAVDGSSAEVGVGVTGDFGVLTLNTNGSYTYVNTDSGAVGAHGVAEDTFNFTVSDGQGNSTGSSLTVLITSANDTVITGAQDFDDPGRERFDGT